MMRLAVLGAGGHGRVVAESAAAAGWDVDFFDDAQTDTVDGRRVIGKLEAALSTPRNGVIVALGNNRLRLDWINRLRAAGSVLATIIDPTAMVSPSAEIGEGSFLARGAVVSTGARIGRGCIVNTAATVDHDCRLADGVHLSPGVHLSGSVTVGACSWLGTGVSVSNNISIGDDVIVGIGGAVIRNVASNQTVVGVPARPVEKQ